MEMVGPEPPSQVERELHELTHLPYAPWCESCVRGRGKDLPHRKVEPPEKRLLPMVCLDWFVAASSDEAGRKSEGTTDVLLMIDAETGYVAAIPAKSKGAENHPDLVDLAEKNSAPHATRKGEATQRRRAHHQKLSPENQRPVESKAHHCGRRNSPLQFSQQWTCRACSPNCATTDKRWDSELFFGFRGVPWDVTADALPAKPRSKVMVHFTIPSSEVVPQPDGSNLTHGAEAVEPQAVGEDQSSGCAPTTPLAISEPGDLNLLLKGEKARATRLGT